MAVDDIISYGRDREPRWRRWRQLAVVAACITAALPAAFIWYLPGLRHPGRGNDYQLVPIAGGWAAQPSPAYTLGTVGCAPSSLPVYYIADGSQAASRIGTVDVTAPLKSGEY
jgi:hypothetical protein